MDTGPNWLAHIHCEFNDSRLPDALDCRFSRLVLHRCLACPVNIWYIKMFTSHSFISRKTILHFSSESYPVHSANSFPVSAVAIQEQSRSHSAEFKRVMLALGIVAAVLFVILALLVCTLRKRIKFAIVLIKEGSR